MKSPWVLCKIRENLTCNKFHEQKSSRKKLFERKFSLLVPCLSDQKTGGQLSPLSEGSLPLVI